MSSLLIICMLAIKKAADVQRIRGTIPLKDDDGVSIGKKTISE